MHKYNYRICYTRGKWYGRSIVPAINDFYNDKGSVSAYSEKQARFLVSKRLQDRVGCPIFIADFSAIPVATEENETDYEQLCFI